MISAAKLPPCGCVSPDVVAMTEMGSSSSSSARRCSAKQGVLQAGGGGGVLNDLRLHDGGSRRGDEVLNFNQAGSSRCLTHA